MGSDVASSPIVVSLVREVVSLVCSDSVLVHGESDEARHVLLLCPRLDIEADIDEDSIFSLWITILDHELAGHCRCHTLLHLKHHIDLLFAKVLLHLLCSHRVL